MTPAHHDTALLSQDDVRQLERLGLTSLDALTRGLIGQREGAGPGAGGVAFAESRRYAPGDDLRRLDWHAYGRLRELMVNSAPAPERLGLVILLDTSASMGSPGSGKHRYGRRLAALLGTVGLLRSDAVQLQVLSDAVAIPGGRLDAAGMLGGLAEEAAGLPGGRRTDLAASISDAIPRTERSGLVVLISDCLVPGSELTAALGQLGRAARSAALLHVLDPAEASAGPLGAVELRDSESGQMLSTVITAESRSRYAERYAAYRADTERRCRETGVHYLPASTEVDPLERLAELARTGELIRRRSAA